MAFVPLDQVLEARRHVGELQIALPADIAGNVRRCLRQRVSGSSH